MPKVPSVTVSVECPGCGYVNPILEVPSTTKKGIHEAKAEACVSCDEELALPRVAVMRAEASAAPEEVAS